MLQFNHPGAFFLLLCFPALFILRKLGVFRRFSFPLILSDWGGSSFEWHRPFFRFASLVSHSILAIGFLSAVISLTDPILIHQQKVYTTRGSDVLFVVDTSPSMAALDIGTGSRLDAAITVISQLATSQNGAFYSLVAMGSEAALIVPPTQDTEHFLNRIHNLHVGELGDGTAIGTGLATGVYHLVKSSAPQKCIILLTDGENNSGAIHPVTAANLAASNDISVYTVALGTQGNVPVEYTDPNTGKVYSGYLDSHFDSSFLSTIAAATGGTSYTVESLPVLYDTLQTVIKKEAVAQSYQLHNTAVSYHRWFLYLAVGCILISWFIRRVYLKELI
ncbi:MAG: VWA domain-containing protein [Treponemataceae bacterium]|nr:VWA domain-containing protein [Treponemataceae bacterium]